MKRQDYAVQFTVTISGIQLFTIIEQRQSKKHNMIDLCSKRTGMCLNQMQLSVPTNLN